jgi:serine/threonine-protein kinase PRP4
MQQNKITIEQPNKPNNKINNNNTNTNTNNNNNNITKKIPQNTHSIKTEKNKLIQLTQTQLLKVNRIIEESKFENSESESGEIKIKKSKHKSKHKKKSKNKKNKKKSKRKNSERSRSKENSIKKTKRIKKKKLKKRKNKKQEKMEKIKEKDKDTEMLIKSESEVDYGEIDESKLLKIEKTNEVEEMRTIRQKFSFQMERRVSGEEGMRGSALRRGGGDNGGKIREEQTTYEERAEVTSSVGETMHAVGGYQGIQGKKDLQHIQGKKEIQHIQEIKDKKDVQHIQEIQEKKEIQITQEIKKKKATQHIHETQEIQKIKQTQHIPKTQKKTEPITTLIPEEINSNSNSESDLFASESRSSHNPKTPNNPINQEQANDAELYYKPIIGETLHNKYKVISILGKGVYSLVLKVEHNNREYALKILRKAEVIRESGEREIEILEMLNQDKSLRKCFIIEILDSFDHKGFLCIVLEMMGLNLRDMLNFKRKGKNFSIEEVRLHAWQLLQALAHLQSKKILHLDIKPDNILYDSVNKVCKLTDFGTSIEVEEAEQGKEYVSRYYRAPEVFLGGQLGHGVDIWSMACTFYEMFCGQFLFAGKNDPHMVDLFLVTKGRVSLKYLKKCQVRGVMLWCIMVYYVMVYYVMVCYVMLYYVMMYVLCYIMMILLLFICLYIY